MNGANEDMTFILKRIREIQPKPKSDEHVKSHQRLCTGRGFKR